MKEIIREHLTFSGRVQGVGFRYRLSCLAGNYGLTGWVRNEYDKTVSAELQGSEEEIDLIIQNLSTDCYIRIEHVRRIRIPPVPEEAYFHTLN